MADENEKKDSSAVGKINSLYSKTRNLQSAYNVYKKARLAMAAGEGLGSLAAAVPIAIGIILGIVVFVLLFGGGAVSTVVGGNQTSPSPSTPPPGIYTCLSGNYPACLKQDFNIVVTGQASPIVVENIYFSFAFASKSSLYHSLLTTGGKTLYIQDVYAVGCHGYTPSGGTLIYVYDGGCDRASLSAFRHFIIHEAGHIMAARNPGLFQSFPHISLSSQDSSCYEFSSCGPKAGYFLKPYSLRYYCPAWSSACIGIDARGESFAEAIADYLTPTDGFTGSNCSKTINNFNTTCSNTFSWLKTNVFGGYTFY